MLLSVWAGKLSRIPSTAVHEVVLAGIEAHICVQQTALDLLAAGYRVIIPVDAVASRNKLDWEIAIRRMENSGAQITTTESILFEWCEVAGTRNSNRSVV